VLTDDAKYDALVTREPRWDGVFFVGVSTTGIYCRPICTARTPGRNRCTFYDTAVQAEAAGFRACFRCRPELAPGNAEVDAVDKLVAAATARINEGALNDGSVDDLAAELGVSARHLRRTMEAKLGVTPVDLAQSRRLALAKQLLQDTSLSLTEIAFAAGFGSVRRFNAVFANVMGRAPSTLRRMHVDAKGIVDGALVLRLDYREPYDFAGILRFLAARAIPGVEVVERDCYRRSVRIGKHAGAIEVRKSQKRAALELAVSPSLVAVMMPLVASVRRMFDLDARPDVIARVLSRDPLLAPLVAARPGLRVPGVIDGFEAAVRAMLGQQVSVAAATTLAGRLAKSGAFPTAKHIANGTVDAVAAIGLPRARAAAIHALATAVAAGTVKLDGVMDLDTFVRELVELPGIGPWTAHYLAMRALHLPDAFPAADLGIKKALGGANPREAEARAEAWRPFRSYAVMYLWSSLGGADVEDDDREVTDRRADARRQRERARRAAPSGRPRASGQRDRARQDAVAHARRDAARRVLRR
jgi:AraC family transcriptional regulator of adaptative response / DNA-3-methyladenine glycosylase II